MTVFARLFGKWEIILYFFLGGLAGGSFLVATVAHLFGSTKDAPLVRAGRYLAFGSILRKTEPYQKFTGKVYVCPRSR